MALFPLSWRLMVLLSIQVYSESSVNSDAKRTTCFSGAQLDCVESDPVATANNTNDTIRHHLSVKKTLPPPQCGLYVAPSTIPHAGLGMFTAVPRKKDEEIGYGDVVVPVLEVPWHMGEDPFLNMFDDYLWSAENYGLKFEGELVEELNAFAPGVGSVANSHLGLVNLDTVGFGYDDGVGGHRSQSPSSGAMTPYHDQRTVATEDVAAGGELFKSYGDEWFVSRTEAFGLVPLLNDYPAAEELLVSLRTMEEELNLTESIRNDLYDLLLDPLWKSRVLNVLPRDYELVDEVVDDSIRAVHQRDASRSLEYLKENGRCLDNTEPKNSTLPLAGRGAFATRDLTKGTIVTGSPLLHVPFHNMAKMWGKMEDDGGDEIIRDTSNFVGWQLFYNYCFGHSESTLLLCPYGSGVHYINHNQTLANVKVQWAPDGTVAHDDTWLTRGPEEMQHVSRTLLGLDFVATRDIAEGEELLLDYGNDYEQAWQEHVAKWSPSEEDFTYVSAAQWNREHANDTLLAVVEQRENPYPENLILRCHPMVWDEGEQRTFEMSPADYDEEYADTLWPNEEKGHHCLVYDRMKDEEEITYTVEIWDEDEDKSRICESVPREMLMMIDSPYTTDLHQEGAFRHFIGIPEEIMPTAWKGRRRLDFINRGWHSLRSLARQARVFLFYQ